MFSLCHYDLPQLSICRLDHRYNKIGHCRLAIRQLFTKIRVQPSKMIELLWAWEYRWYIRRQNLSILHLSCRTSDLQFSLVLQTHALVLSFTIVCNKVHKGVICNMTSSSNSSQSTRPTYRMSALGRTTRPF